MAELLIWIILLPIAIVVLFVVTFAWVIGFVVCMNVYKAGKHPSVDGSNYLIRLLAWVQTTRHIPKLMNAIFVYDVATGVGPWDIAAGSGYTLTKDNWAGPHNVILTRPLLKMQAQDLMEQMDFRPDDGRVTD